MPSDVSVDRVARDGVIRSRSRSQWQFSSIGQHDPHVVIIHLVIVDNIVVVGPPQQDPKLDVVLYDIRINGEGVILRAEHDSEFVRIGRIRRMFRFEDFLV